MIRGLMLVIGLVGFGLYGWSRDYSIILVEKELDMGLGKEPRKDFYVNMGAAQGLQIGSHLAVSRRIPVVDHFNGKNTNDVLIPVAALKVIHVEKDMAIARLTEMVKEDTSPVAGVSAPMVGDFIDLQTAEP